VCKSGEDTLPNIAAPNDNIWGIGLVKEAPEAANRETWSGKNLLGEILTQIRFEIDNKY
jgi:predicted NAD-dependent protein-ADP-ribosyltransferase YbiA (DUF1768 family)